MITSVLAAVQPGRPMMTGGDARAGAAPDATAFAALVGSAIPGGPDAGSVTPDDDASPATERQDDAVSDVSLPAASMDGAGDARWLSALLASTVLVQQPVSRADPATPTTPGSTPAGARAASASMMTVVQSAPDAAITPPAPSGEPRDPLPALDKATPAIAGSPSFSPERSDGVPRLDARLIAVVPPPACADASASPGALISRPSSPGSQVIAPPLVQARTEGSVLPIGTSQVAPVADSNGVAVPAPVASSTAPAASAPTKLAIPLRGPLSVVAPVVDRLPGPVAPTEAPALTAAPVIAAIPPAPTPVIRRALSADQIDDPSSRGARTPSQTSVPAALPAATMSPVSLAMASSPESLAVAPAGEVFASAIRAAGQRERSGGANDDIAVLSPAALAGAAPFAIPPAVAPAGGADPSLDMRHGHWPGAMIDHIEKLRDAADAVDTRIRVVPDALGGIDVSLRRHDDGVQVTLRADHPATQAMLAEARPQLTAMAEARGIRLAEGGLAGGAGTGAGGGNNAGDPSNASGRRPSAIPTAPASAFATATTRTNPDPADGRVA